jgi:hypothetical protein
VVFVRTPTPISPDGDCVMELAPADSGMIWPIEPVVRLTCWRFAPPWERARSQTKPLGCGCEPAVSPAGPGNVLDGLSGLVVVVVPWLFAAPPPQAVSTAPTETTVMTDSDLRRRGRWWWRKESGGATAQAQADQHQATEGHQGGGDPTLEEERLAGHFGRSSGNGST